MSTALVIKIGAIGDAIMALPLARTLKSQGKTVHWLGGKSIRDILSNAPEIDKTIILNDSRLFGSGKVSAILEVFQTWRNLGFTNYDEIYLLHADSRYKLLIPPWVQKSRVRTMRTKTRRHYTFEYARLALPDMEDPEISVEPYVAKHLISLPRKNRVCLFPGGAKNTMRDDPLRRWPVENFAKLALKLTNDGIPVTILGAPSDSWIEDAFSSLRSKVDWQVGNFSLSETLRYLGGSSLCISHDSGPIHLASMADCPVISLFGPTPSRTLAPLKYMNYVIEMNPLLDCQPCYDGRDYGRCSNNICLTRITPEQVATFAEKILNSR